ncbi:MAG: LysE family translocator [Phenylobacterium sp.]|uniref:LysE family translocator n=1 Tax=Phenylobacterium sp. TaxID=1871053 RepID=UPI00391B78F3
METLPLFLKACGVGLAVAAPVGPMALLCMRRTLTRGWGQGLATGAGIAVGDACFAAVAALGLAGVSAFMLAHQEPLHLAAGLFLIWLGLKTFFRKAEEAEAVRPESASLAGAFAGSVLLTLTNPPTIIMFAAVFAALAPAHGFQPATAAVTVAGVFTGSMLWWIGMVAVVAAARHAVGRRARRWIDRVSGAVLAAFGLAEIRRAM